VGQSTRPIVVTLRAQRRDTGFTESERETECEREPAGCERGTSLPVSPVSQPHDPFNWTLRRYPVPPRPRYSGKVSVKVLIHVTLPTGYTATYGKW